MTKNKKIAYIALFSIVVITIAVFLVSFINAGKKEKISYNDFIDKIESGAIEEVKLSDSPQIIIKIKNDSKEYITDNPRNENLKEFLLINDISVDETETASAIIFLQRLFSVAFLSAALYLIFKMIVRNNKNSLMALETSEASKEIIEDFGFHQVAGNEEAKDSISDVVDFIKNPEKYNKNGARMPKGIIFYGPPGTGKTLMARAVAGEAGVPFFAVSGSDFVQMYVGVGASRIRELFKQARKAEKAVIFIDEIDAIGKKRSHNTVSGNEERDQTLNALLTEMSGFENDEGIVVIAATNRLDILDQALLRAGRFDRQIEIGLPDIKEREHILKIHSLKKPLDKNIDIADIAKKTVYFSGAMLENLLNEAAITVSKENRKIITNEDIDKALYTVIAGSEKKDRTIFNETDKKITAYHEAGHAVITKLTQPKASIAKITIIPSTKGAGGFCLSIPPDKMYLTKKDIESRIMINYGGRAAEEIMFGNDNITTGAGNDIEKATELIKDYVVKYGMSKKNGIINTSLFEGSDDKILNECINIAQELYTNTVDLLKENIEKLNTLADLLLEKESLEEDEIDFILKN